MPSLTCPSCRAALEPNERYGTESMVCTACHGVVSVAHGKAKLLAPQEATAAQLATDAPLRLGARGTLRNKELEVTGIIERADGGYLWHEIAVADSAGDITWLWVDRGHFSLGVCEGKHCVDYGADHQYRYGGQRLHKFNRGTARVVAAAGQFPYEVDFAERPEIIDYIAPPFVASHESLAWWVFEYVPVAEIEAAFGISCPAPDGIGINQPAPHQAQRRAFGIVTVIALLALGLVHALTGQHPIQLPLVAGTVDLSDPKNPAPQSFGPFELERPWNVLSVTVSSPVANAWADLTLALVDQATGRSYWTSHGVEFYQGTDQDGYWSEGSQQSTTLVRSIPKGKYMLLAHGETGIWSVGAAPSSATVAIFDHPAPNSNLLLAVLFVFGFAGLFVWQGHRFEARRWENSDYNPDGTQQ